MKKILGLDLGSNSIGWALMRETDGEVSQIIDLGSRIFNKAVEEGI
jgi:CRISPR-associated endonuclease Csn1